MYAIIFKRIFDFSTVLIGLILLSPIFLIVMIGLFYVNNGKPFFVQKRPGKNERIFKIIKFKTMNDKKDINDNLLPDSQRLTCIGKWIRRTSLDEIPQLINVLKGEMSLVGPRPLLPEYLPLYNNEQKKRHNVRPGITGWAQVNGRNAISWTQKLALDTWYVEHQHALLDLKILWKTFLKVWASEGINAQGQATTTLFNGKN